MNYLIKTAVALSTISMLASVAAAGQKPKPAAKTMVCPYCKMKMTTTKSKAAPVAVKLKSGTFYCCTTCKPAPKKKG